MSHTIAFILVIFCGLVSLRCLIHAFVWCEHERPIDFAWYGVGVCAGLITLGLCLMSVHANESVATLPIIGALAGFASFSFCGGSIVLNWPNKG